MSDAPPLATSPAGEGTADAPPKRGRGRPRKGDTAPRGTPPPRAASEPRRPPGRPPLRAPLRQQLEDFYGGTGMMLSVWSPYVGGVVLESSPHCAQVVEQACQQNPAVRAVVERVLQTSVLGQVIGAHMPIVLAVATRLRVGEPDPSALNEARAAAAAAGEATPQPPPGAPPAGFPGFAPGADLGAMLGDLNRMADAAGIRPTPANGATA
jgi:hypothetical protein